MSTKDTYLFTAVLLLVLIGIVGTSRDGVITGMQVYDTNTIGAGLQTQPSLTPLDSAVQFLRNFGCFSVVLPFLLIFTIVFGVLEKTKIFGTEKHKGEDVPRRNLNSVVAFCIAFFVVAATNVVNLLQVSLPMVALVLVVIIMFLLLFGSLMGAEKLKGGIDLWQGHFKTTFVVVITIALLAIILVGFGILDDLWAYASANFSGTFITSLLLLIIVVGAIWFVTGKRGEGEKGGTS